MTKDPECNMMKIMMNKEDSIYQRQIDIKSIYVLQLVKLFDQKA